MNCLHKLRFTRKSRLEYMLVRENNVVGAEVFPHVAKDNNYAPPPCTEYKLKMLVSS